MKFIIALLLFTLSVSEAKATDDQLTHMMFLTGDQLAGICNGSVRSVDRSEMCKMYIAGVLDDISVEQSLNIDSIPVCAPKGTTVDQVIEVVNSYWRGLEKKFNGPAAMMVRVALTKWQPCPLWMWDDKAK